MSDTTKTYTDFINKTAITVPDRFIDVKTGNSLSVSPKIQEQIEYHTNNNTLVHLLLSALNHYFHKPVPVPKGAPQDVLQELSEIRRMLQQGYIPLGPAPKPSRIKEGRKEPKAVDLLEVKDVLEAFGG
ncbi:hypothetical protein [Bacillus sp. T33-2]|uniref:hypothetical protein n=1 Tax=Bacillus sp. T33-2 TaxID=2054168 RepID=UPI000C780A49|nr:hypothetical protein [Bacillus sp. T33-2]PLR97525.1 hypothetical protein CVD19_08560 [Bacillus sp. T33-2]